MLWCPENYCRLVVESKSSFNKNLQLRLTQLTQSINAIVLCRNLEWLPTSRCRERDVLFSNRHFRAGTAPPSPACCSSCGKYWLSSISGTAVLTRHNDLVPDGHLCFVRVNKTQAYISPNMLCFRNDQGLDDNSPSIILSLSRCTMLISCINIVINILAKP